MTSGRAKEEQVMIIGVGAKILSRNSRLISMIYTGSRREATKQKLRRLD
jgi:hypothetical protein